MNSQYVIVWFSAQGRQYYDPAQCIFIYAPGCGSLPEHFRMDWNDAVKRVQRFDKEGIKTYAERMY